MAVMIGIDPHKGSHTAVALDEDEQLLGELRVRSAASQLERLLGWAAPFADRTWAVEGAGGLGYLLAQQLVAAGERVVDVQPKLAARVRLLATGDTNKNDPNDARSVAVAALRSGSVPEVRAEDHAKVMKVWAKRHRDLSRHRTRVACRLHAVLCDLVPGGIAGEISAAQATRLLDELDPAGAVATARHAVAVELVADLGRLDDQLRDTKKRITAAVKASNTTVTELFGVGPIVAAIVIGDVGDVSRFPTRDRFAAYNGTARSRCPPGGARSIASRGVATGASTTPSTWRRSPRSATATAPGAPTTTARSRKATAARKRSGRSNGASATPSTPDFATTPSRPSRQRRRAREGTRGTTLSPARPAHTPNTGSSAKPLPDPTPPYDRPATELAPRGRRHPRPVSEKPLDKQRGLDMARSNVPDRPSCSRSQASHSVTDRRFPDGLATARSRVV